MILDRDDAKNWVKIIQALADGKRIQARYFNLYEGYYWQDINAIDLGINPWVYRVVEEDRCSCTL